MVPVVHKNNVVDYEKTAKRIIAASCKAIKPYEQMWSDASENMNNLYKELYEKYKKLSDEGKLPETED
jgi:hypothetical protein